MNGNYTILGSCIRNGFVSCVQLILQKAPGVCWVHGWWSPPNTKWYFDAARRRTCLLTLALYAFLRADDNRENRRWHVLQALFEANVNPLLKSFYSSASQALTPLQTMELNYGACLQRQPSAPQARKVSSVIVALRAYEHQWQVWCRRKSVVRVFL